MLAAGRGDRDAFGILVQRHHRAIVQFAHRFLATADRATAEDLAQQAFLGAWRYAPTFQPRAKVLTWLFRIATNACLNYRRYEDARPKVPLDEAAEQPADDSADISDVEDGPRRLRAAVAALPPNQRAAIVLRHFHEFSYAEIAGIMQTSVAAVDALLHRARLALHTALGAEED